MEGARDRLPRWRSFAAGGVEVGRECRPACGAEKRVEILRGHGAAGMCGIRQGVRLQQMAAGFNLPQDAFFGRGVIVLVLDMDQMKAPGLAVEGFDGSDHATPVAHGGKHSGAGDGDCVRRRHESASRSDGGSDTLCLRGRMQYGRRRPSSANNPDTSQIRGVVGEGVVRPKLPSACGCESSLRFPASRGDSKCASSPCAS